MAWLLFSILALFWGFSFIAIHIALEAFPPFFGAALRIGMAAVLLFALARWKGLPFPRDRMQVIRLWMIGLVNFAIPWGLLFWGQQYVFPAIAAVLDATVPLFVLMISWPLFRDEQPTPAKVFGVFLGFVGVVGVFLPAFQTAEIDFKSFYGMSAIVLMSLSYALGAAATKKYLTRTAVEWNLAIQGGGSALLLFFISFLFEGYEWFGLEKNWTRSFVAVAYLSIFSTAIAWIIYFHLLSIWGALRATAVTYVIPFVAIVIDFVYLKKFPEFHQIWGTALIIISVLAIHYATKPPKEKKSVRKAA